MNVKTSPTRRYRPVSPATYALAQAGSSQRDIAERAGCSLAYVGMALAGEKPMPDRIIRALEEALGQRGAWRVLGAVPEWEVAATPQRST